MLGNSIQKNLVQFSEPVRSAGPSGSHSVTNPASYVLTGRHGQVHEVFAAPTVAPTLTSTPVSSVVAGALYHYLVSETDGPDAVTFSLINPPPGMTFDSQSGLVTWQPTTANIGAHPIDIRLTNERGAVTEQTFTLTVAPDTKPTSVSVSLSSSLSQPGQTVTITVCKIISGTTNFFRRSPATARR